MASVGTVEKVVEHGLHPRGCRGRTGPASELRKGNFKSIWGITYSGLDCVLVCADGPGLLSRMALVEITGSRKNGFKREKEE